MVLNTFQTEKAVSHLFVKELYVFRVDRWVPSNGKYGCYTAVFHAHEWKRPDKKDCYDQLKTLCEEYSEEIVDFKEYAKQKTGIPFVEYMDEKMYIFYENKIKAALRPMVHVIKSMLRNIKEKNQRLV